MNTLLQSPDAYHLQQAHERAPLYLLAAAVACVQTTLRVEHPHVYEPPIDAHDDRLPSAVSLAARQLDLRLKELASCLQLYEAALRDHLCATRDDNFPF